MFRSSFRVSRLLLILVISSNIFSANTQEPVQALDFNTRSQRSQSTTSFSSAETNLAAQTGAWECVGSDLPDPCRNTLNSVDMISESLGWAVGEKGTILNWNGTNWTKLLSPTTSSLKSVDAVTSSLGWAVGEQGTILQWNGSSWSIATSPTTRTLYAVKMFSPTEGYAVGDRQILLHWNGTAWNVASDRDDPYGDFRTLDVIDSQSVWVAGRNSGVLHWNGSDWDESGSLYSSQFNSIDFISATEGWVVGENAFSRYQGGTWTDYSLPPGVNYNDGYSVNMVSSTDGWITGRYLSNNGYFYHWDGNAWTAVSEPTIFNSFSLSMTSTANGWAVGEGGQVLHFTNGTWQVYSSPQYSILSSVSMLSANDGWAVGLDANGTALTHWDGNNWSNEPLPDLPHLRYLNAINMVSANEGWAVGYEGQILRTRNGLWSSSYSGYGNSGFNAVEQVSSSDVWVAASYSGNVNPNVSMFHWNGTDWGAITTPAKSTLYAMKMVASDDGWAVGTGGSPALIHWDGIKWSAFSDTTISGSSIDMLSSTDGWIAGGNAFYHWNGTTWVSYPYPTEPNSGQYPLAIKMVGHDDVWAVGTFGTTFYWDGNGWISVASLTTNHIRSISTGVDGSLWAVGDYGVTLRLKFNSPFIEKPIIFLPGILGSVLVNNPKNGPNDPVLCKLRPQNEIWLATDLWQNPFYGVNLSTLILKDDGISANNDCDQIRATSVIGNTYSDFINTYNQANRPVYLFAYDWRMDYEFNAIRLDNLINQLNLSNSKPILIAHSMGGLIARQYVSQSNRAKKISAIITVGTPYWGSPKSAYSMRSGTFGFPLFDLGIPATGLVSKVLKTISRNSLGILELLPSKVYFNQLAPSGYFRYEGNLIPTYPETENFFRYNDWQNGQNWTLIDSAELLHDHLDDFRPINNVDPLNGVPYFILEGNHKKTASEIREYTQNLIKHISYEEYTSGDDTVPWGSASLKGIQGDWSGQAKVCTVKNLKEGHGSLMNDSQIIKVVGRILNGSDYLDFCKESISPVSVKSVALSTDKLIQVFIIGDVLVNVTNSQHQYAGLQDGIDFTNNIPLMGFDVYESGTILSLPDGDIYTVNIKPKSVEPFEVKVSEFENSLAEAPLIPVKRALFMNISASSSSNVSLPIDFSADLASLELSIKQDGLPGVIVSPNIVTGPVECVDYISPHSTIQVSGNKDSLGYYVGNVLVNLAASDEDSGVYETSYSLDKGESWLKYSAPFSIVAENTPVLFVRSIDGAGNVEDPWSRIALRPFTIRLPIIRR